MCQQYVFQSNTDVAVNALFSDFLSITLSGFFFSCWRPIATKCRNAFPFNIDFKKTKIGHEGNSLVLQCKNCGFIAEEGSLAEAAEILLWKKLKKKL